MTAKRIYKIIWRAFLLCLDVAGFLALRLIGVESKSVPARREKQNGRASGFGETIPAIAEPLHCPRCTELLEEQGPAAGPRRRSAEQSPYFVCNGCDSAWTNTPEGLVPGRLHAGMESTLPRRTQRQRQFRGGKFEQNRPGLQFGELR